MDFANYTDLQAAIADFLNRDDLSAQIPGFIALAEAKIQRNLRRATVRNDAFVISTEATALPADCAELRYLLPLTGTPTRDRAVRIVTPAALADERVQTAGVAGTPIIASVISGNLVVAPPPQAATTYRIIYFQKLVPLSGGNPTNAVLLEAPDIYLYGALIAAAPYLEHDERIPVWTSLFDDAVEELNEVRAKEEFAGNVKVARLPVFF